MPIPVGDPATSSGVGFPFGETVALITAGTVTDPYSDEDAESWADEDVSSVDVPGVGVEPRPSGEPLEDARNRVTSGFTLYFPPSVTPTPFQRVVVRGKTYKILGETAVWKNPFTGWTPGNVVQCELVEG
jgi:hypothetical protein